MERTSYQIMECPIARTLEEVGEWWSMLILRDAFHGLTRFDQFRRSLGIAPNMLTRRLDTLVTHELLERRRYSEHPPRDEYVLTTKGLDFQPVMLALLTWGNKNLTCEGGPAILVADRSTGVLLEPIMVDRQTLKPMPPGSVRLLAGPGAGPEIHNRINQIEQRRQKTQRALSPKASAASADKKAKES